MCVCSSALVVRASPLVRSTAALASALHLHYVRTTSALRPEQHLINSFCLTIAPAAGGFNHKCIARLQMGAVLRAQCRHRTIGPLDIVSAGLARFASLQPEGCVFAIVGENGRGH